VIHAVALLGVHELIHADRVAVGHDGPIVGVAVDARDLVGRELKNLEGDVRAFQPGCTLLRIGPAAHPKDARCRVTRRLEELLACEREAWEWNSTAATSRQWKVKMGRSARPRASRTTRERRTSNSCEPGRNPEACLRRSNRP
jgi:hypothetical protein